MEKSMRDDLEVDLSVVFCKPKNLEEGSGSRRGPRRKSKFDVFVLDSESLALSSPVLDRRSGDVAFVPEFSSSRGSDQSRACSSRTDNGDGTEKIIREIAERQGSANSRRSARTRNQTRFTNRPSIFESPNGLQPQIEKAISPQFIYEEENPDRLLYGSRHFHFSIYKWASTEMSLFMPYNLMNKGKSSGKIKRDLQEEKDLSTPRKEQLKSRSGGLCVDRDADARLLKHEKKLFSSFPATKYGSRDQKSTLDKPGGVTVVRETGLQERYKKGFLKRFNGQHKGPDSNAIIQLEIAEKSDVIRERQPLAGRFNKNVKEFTNIFNNEASRFSKAKFETTSRSSVTRNQDSELKDTVIDQSSPSLARGIRRFFNTTRSVSVSSANSEFKDYHTLEAPGTPMRQPGSGV